MRNSIKYLFAIQLPIAATIFSACTTAPSDENEGEAQVADSASAKNVVVIAGADFTDFHGSAERMETENGEVAVTDTGKHWLDYAVIIPEAGRYRISITAAGDTGTVMWIEDYRVNKDDRTYNITGNIAIESTVVDGLAAHMKTGSPMNAGEHEIRLHVEGAARIGALKFELIKAHIPTPTNMVQATDGEEWTVVWADEFDTEGLPDTTKWTYDVGDWGWGNHELQYYTKAKPENARIENGHLIIEAHKDENGKWTSARLTTREKVSFTYGRIEFSAKVPAEKGNWSAGWTLGDSYVDELSWPYCGEIDILESVGYQMDNETGNGTAHASAHSPAYYFKLGNQPTATTEVKNMNGEFHTYAVDWTPESIIAYVDGDEYFVYDDTSNELTWPFDQPQNIILNLTMGGGWGGLEGMDESVTSQKMTVDYVRVYEKKK